MNDYKIKLLIEDLRLNHEYCPKEVILQAANELERMQKGIENLHALYIQVSLHRDELMSLQLSSLAETRKTLQ